MVKTTKTDKERRLIEQNQAEIKRLSGFKTNIFMANRFGPLMFALSFGIIGVYFAVMSFAAVPADPSRAVRLSIEPSSRSIKKGQTVVVRVWSDSMEQAVASVQAGLMYSTDKFEFVAVDPTGSSFPGEEAVQVAAGSVVIRRSTPPEAGDMTGRHLVAKVTFLAKTDTATGNADMWFSGDSRLLRAGDQTNILQRTDGSRYYVSLLRPRLNLH